MLYTVIQQNGFSHESCCGASSGPESCYMGFSPHWNPSLTDLWVLVFPAPDGPPQEVHLEPISSQSIRVTWKVNPASTHPPGTFSVGVGWGAFTHIKYYEAKACTLF